MLTVKQVAEKLKVSASTVYQLVESGEMPHYRIKSSIRVSDEQLAAYLEGIKKEGLPMKAAPAPRRAEKKSTYTHITLH